MTFADAIRVPFSACLDNGLRVHVREVRPEDRALLQTGFAALSDRSRFFRFLHVHPALSQEELARFAAGNDETHVAIGAVTDEATPRPLGTARYIRPTPGSDTAEIAVTVVDHAQRAGLGRLLLGALAEHAMRRGLASFSALVHAENRAMLGLLRRLGGTVTERRGSEVEMRLDLPLPA